MNSFTRKFIRLFSLLASLNLFAQYEITPEMFHAPRNTGANMTFGISMPTSIILDQFDGAQIGAFYDLNGNGDIDIPYTYSFNYWDGSQGGYEIGECVGLVNISRSWGFFAIALWGDDSSTPEIDGLPTGAVPEFAILTNEPVQQVIRFIQIPNFQGYVTNGLSNATEAQFIGPYGCTDVNACNSMFMFDGVSYEDDGSCQYAEQYYDCYGMCLNDGDGDGVCDELEIPGCQDPLYLEYNSEATDDDGSCSTLIVYGCTYSIALNYNPLANVNDGSCQVEGCTNDYADNFSSLANIDDGSCVRSGCTDQSASNALIVYNDITYTDDGSCEYPGCMNPIALNYDEDANIDDGSCQIGGCINDYADNFNNEANVDDGSCTRLGCADLYACNTLTIYEEINYIDDGSCEYPEQYYNCFGNCVNDSDNDLVCDELEIPGCQNENYVEYNPNATDEDGSCEVTWQQGYQYIMDLVDCPETLLEVQNLSYQLDTLTNAYQTLMESPQCEEIIIDIEEGWNIFGYTSSQIVDIGEVMAPYDDKIYIIKDNYGSQYWPANDYNGIGNFIPGGGYQIKAYDSFSISFEN